MKRSLRPLALDLAVVLVGACETQLDLHKSSVLLRQEELDVAGLLADVHLDFSRFVNSSPKSPKKNPQPRLPS
jgi:hypothetical protein